MALHPEPHNSDESHKAVRMHYVLALKAEQQLTAALRPQCEDQRESTKEYTTQKSHTQPCGFSKDLQKHQKNENIPALDFAPRNSSWKVRFS